ncbi:MAG: hypothetical protein LBD57_00940 [Endomicrobium sp.]|uniref:PHP domain-containing protein n=1 Tax=Candidatus Endomicrobiellum cubanum TaxID=3242325 RepID=UPI00282CF3A2|nr:hypothetical protein [Endomicrobium sp.]
MKYKSVNFFLILPFLMIVTYIIFNNPINLYDLVNQKEMSNFSIVWPKIRILLEPIYSFIFYALTLNRNFYKPVIISWILWTVSIAILYSLLNKQALLKWLHNIFYSLMLLFTLFSFVALVPIPGPRLEKPKNYVTIDIHSHTLVSHDNVAPDYISLKAHIWQGYDVFFNTEHNHSDGFANFPNKLKYKIVYPGMQMQTKDKISVLMLSSKEFNGNDYKNLSLEELIRKAHSNGMIVIMPHWWKWHIKTFSELKDLGIDGFEIYNCGYRNFDINERDQLIKFCIKNNLPMFGVTDWHGWGYMSDVWTVFEGDLSVNIEEQLAKKIKTNVILYRQEQSDSTLRFVFEPFCAFYYYVKNVQLKYFVSFIIWILVIFYVVFNKFFKYIKKYLPLFMTLLYSFTIVYFYIIVKNISTNNIVIKSVIPMLITFCLLWFVLWRLDDTNKSQKHKI